MEAPQFFWNGNELTCRCGETRFTRDGTQWDTETVQKQYSMVFAGSVSRQYGVDFEIDESDYGDVVDESHGDTIESGEDMEFEDTLECVGCLATIDFDEVEDLPSHDPADDEDEDEDDASESGAPPDVSEPEPEPQPPNTKKAKDLKRGDVYMDIMGAPMVVRHVRYLGDKVAIERHIPGADIMEAERIVTLG